MTVTVITLSALQILVISSCDLYHPLTLNELIAHNLASRILDLGASIPWRGWEGTSCLEVKIPTALPIPSQYQTNKRLVLA
jgi:hypothetical protein